MTTRKPDVLQQAKALITPATFFAPCALPTRLVEGLARLRAPEDQAKVVALFARAAKHYDDGHRPDDGTTMDVMLDRIFPRYGSRAILELLRRFHQTGYLVRDRLSDLIPAALENLDAPQDAGALIQIFAGMFDVMLDTHEPPFALLERSLRRTGKHLPEAERRRLRGALAARQRADARRVDLARRIEGASAPALVAILREEGFGLFGEHHWAVATALQKHLGAVPFPLLADLARAALEAGANVYGLAPVVGYLFLKDGRKAEAFVAQAAGTPGTSAALSEVLETVLRWSGEHRHDPAGVEYLTRVKQSPRTQAALDRARRKLDQRDPRRLAASIAADASREFERVEAAGFAACVARWTTNARHLPADRRSEVDSNARRDAVRRLHARLSPAVLADEVRHGLDDPDSDPYATADAFAGLVLRDAAAATKLARASAGARMQEVVAAVLRSASEADVDDDEVEDDPCAALGKRPELLRQVTALRKKGAAR